MKYCLFGAAPDTGNLGVSALCYSTLAAIFYYDSRAKVTVFDYGRGNREGVVRANGREFRYTRCGGFDTRRFYRRESLWNIRASARLGGLGNPGAAAMMSTDAVLDISGGDSFADLYGRRRFWAVTMPKCIALELRRRLILLPQTYGPFRSSRIRSVAERVVRNASMAWARDLRSFESLRALAGSDFDPARHRSGVDVAFALEAVPPAEDFPWPLAHWLAVNKSSRIALNISGLIYNNLDYAADHYGFKANYRELIINFLRRILKATDARVLLVPHVLTPIGHFESDAGACQDMLKSLGVSAEGRVMALPPMYDQSQTKWIISQAEWFCGTRMHSTIAALSSGVPTAAIAYSVKTAGVFETCGQGEHVADPRFCGTEEMAEKLWGSWLRRNDAATSLAESLPLVIQQAKSQMHDIIQFSTETRQLAQARNGVA